MHANILLITLLLVFAEQKFPNTIASNSCRIAEAIAKRERAIANLQEEKWKAPDNKEIRIRLRLKIARLVAIRRGRRAYDRWLISQYMKEYTGKNSEKEQQQKMDTGNGRYWSVLFGALTENLWPIKLCCICWRSFP
jgi:hypothetical protein